MSVTAETVKRIARECGFELAGIAPADPPDDFWRYEAWVAQGFAGEMRYLTDRRADVRRDVRKLLPNARSVICVGKLYNQPSRPAGPGQAIISRYAWGGDYHDVVRAGLERLAGRLREIAAGEGDGFDYKICVDTAPILERTFARLAGLGWIGKNTCLINEPLGSWFFLGEIVTSLEIAADSPPPDRCGTCSRCIEACPTDAFVWTSNGPAGNATTDAGQFTNALKNDALPNGRASLDVAPLKNNALPYGRASLDVAPLQDDALPNGRASLAVASDGHWAIDSTRCIAYFTIELRGDIPEEHRAAMGQHVFGCDICQDVCPWNSHSPVSDAFDARHVAPSLEECARLSEPDFRAMFHDSPMTRAKHAGFLRNVAVAMGNSGLEQCRESLERLAEHTDSMVAGHARWALSKLDHTMEKRVGHSSQLEAV